MVKVMWMGGAIERSLLMLNFKERAIFKQEPRRCLIRKTKCWFEYQIPCSGVIC